MKVHLQLNHTMVVCDPTDTQPLYKERPKVIIEVMSDYKSDHVEKNGRMTVPSRFDGIWSENS